MSCLHHIIRKKEYITFSIPSKGSYWTEICLLLNKPPQLEECNMLHSLKSKLIPSKHTYRQPRVIVLGTNGQKMVEMIGNPLYPLQWHWASEGMKNSFGQLYKTWFWTSLSGGQLEATVWRSKHGGGGMESKNEQTLLSK